VHLARTLVFLTIIFFTLTIIFSFTIATVLSLSNTLLLYLFLVAGYTLAIWLTITGSKSQFNCRRYEITQDTVITFDGIVSCKQRVNNMKGMIGMELDEDSIGKMFNYGTITLKFLGGAEVRIVDIDNPEIYIPKITEIVNKGSTTA